ncbi:MAG TPA: LptA/OstA family protein [Anaeromyxobacteraceae bacterium]|nr:LptA/OstA family protein [Anaeromyxobacteraceae bacterium]
MSLALLLLLALAGDPTLLPGSGAPVRVDAEEVRWLYRTRQVIFTGKPHVRMTRDGMVLTCRRLVADNDERGRIAQAVCTGEVRLVRGPRVITCQTATFDDAAGRVVCEGDPLLRDGATEARGERLTYDLARDEVTLAKPVISVPGAEVEARRREIESRRKREARP